MTDGHRLPDPGPAMAALPPGAGVIFRHYDHPERAILATAAARLAHRRRLVLLIAADWRLAARLGAAGLHLPQEMLTGGRLAPALGWARRARRRVTAACHDGAALARARRLGLDAVLVSPIFPTASHPGAPALGLSRFARLCRQAGAMPVAALGGVTARTARRLTEAGASALAAIGALASPVRYQE